MKIFLTLFVFLFSSSVLGDNISDFQIEGMSIGDSLLDYMSKEEINNGTKFIYERHDKNIGKDIAKTYNDKNLSTYNAVYIDFKTKDNIFEIVALEGTIFYEESIEECYKKQKQVFEEIKLIFKDADTQKEGPVNHQAYPNGEIKKTRYSFFINENKVSNLEVICYDIVEELQMTDRLVVSLKSKEFNEWLEEIYK